MRPSVPGAAKRAFVFTLALSITVALTARPAEAQVGKAIRDTAPPPLKASADLIVQEQLKSRTFPNAFAAIEALRGNWLRQRNMNPAPGTVMNPQSGAGRQTDASPAQQGLPREASGIQVYIDGTRAGGIEALKAIPIASIYSIRRISGTQAQARFGIGHSDGVIYVATGPDK